jgi:hypothetical protein
MEGDSDWLEAWVNFNHTLDENVEGDLHGNRARFTFSSPSPQPTQKGDLDGDGLITTADAVIALQMAVSCDYVEDADVNGDGAVTSQDALMILQASTGGTKV